MYICFFFFFFLLFFFVWKEYLFNYTLNTFLFLQWYLTLINLTNNLCFSFFFIFFHWRKEYLFNYTLNTFDLNMGVFRG